MKNFSDYREMAVRKNTMRAKCLWFTTWGNFINKNRVFISKKILDFGCDIDSICYKQFVRQNGGVNANYYGFDIADTTVGWLKDQNFYYDFWNDNSQKFDAINISEVYEHLDENLRENFIKRSRELLNEGGRLYMDIPYIANLNIIEFFRRDRTHKSVACEDEAIYLERFGFKVRLFIGGYTIPYYNIFINFYRIFTNILLGYKPFLVTFIIAEKMHENNN